MKHPMTIALRWLSRRFRVCFDQSENLRIYLETTLAQIDELSAAVTKLNQAVADLPARIAAQTAPDLGPATSAVNSAADALNALVPATPAQ